MPPVVVPVLGTHPPVCVHHMQCTPRLLAAAELPDNIKCGIAEKRLGVAVRERSSRQDVDRADGLCPG